MHIKRGVVTGLSQGPPGRPGMRAKFKDPDMAFDFEAIQKFGKEQFDAAVASANSFSSGVQSIATAYGEYAKKSFEDAKSFVEKLSGVKSLEKAIELQTEYAKSSYETFVAESQKIGELYTDLAKQAFKPYEGLISKVSPTAH